MLDVAGEGDEKDGSVEDGSSGDDDDDDDTEAGGRKREDMRTLKHFCASEPPYVLILRVTFLG